MIIYDINYNKSWMEQNLFIITRTLLATCKRLTTNICSSYISILSVFRLQHLPKWVGPRSILPIVFVYEWVPKFRQKIERRQYLEKNWPEPETILFVKQYVNVVLQYQIRHFKIVRVAITCQPPVRVTTSERLTRTGINRIHYLFKDFTHMFVSKYFIWFD